MTNTSVLLTKKQKAIIAEALDVMPDDLEEIKIRAGSYKKTSFRDDFSIIFKGNTATLAKMDLTPTAFRIVLYLFSVIDYGNIIPGFSQSRTARELGLNKSNVSRAFRELFERKILLRDAADGQVYLNSNLCVKGIPRRFNEDLMDKFRKSRLKTEDFADSFNIYRAGSKTKPVKKSRSSSPADGIPF
ncbi:helix-turn-helix domain-containing protein [Citrobacter meridianamericanus]|uniref:MarR family transcriptional regulator n=1 Tax=Citrobacter meridianamericanus TaxID=2894201 RepID=A0ABT1BHF2_9ENTR|nr:helix-turn-helix domain-containing protein [Citrobacter meridianamericanus]MCO5784653.1 MarR family transcriptional regulator [Citrobacter meridianamericanus]